MPKHYFEEFEKEFEKIKTERKATPTPTIIGGVYDIPKLQADIETTKNQLASAESALTGYQTKRYDEEYGKAGLQTIKDKVATLDSQIASEKQKRDESISKVRRNPYYSAATITGETAEIERLANATINNLIEERNAMANRYNTTLGEITTKVARETADKEREISGLRYNLERLTGQLGTYETIRQQELARGREASQWELDFAFKLEDAKRKRAEWEAEEERKWAELEMKGKKAVIPAEDIETYARDILAGRLTLTSVPQGIRTQVSKRVEELRKTERTMTNDEIKSQIRLILASRELLGRTDMEKKAYIRDSVALDKKMTEADKERAYQILDEMIPEPKPVEKKPGILKRIKEWFKGKPKPGLPAYRKPLA